MTVPVERRAARVLLVDSAERVLLLHGGDPSAPERGVWWSTPGGGLEPGESPAQAAARELGEETGLRVDAAALGPVVHERVTEFCFDGCDYRQSEHYFLLRVDAHEVDTSAEDAVVDPGVTGHRWWAAPQLRSTVEVIFPAELSAVLERLGCAAAPDT
ncbi:MAG: NUDIX hydrolase [Mycobacteriales bacterium]